MFQMGRNTQDDAAKLIGIFVVIIVAIFAIATFYSLAATLNVDRAITYLEDNGFVVFAAGDVPKVTLVTPAVDADSATTASPSGLEFITDDLTIIRGCSNNEILKWVEITDIWNCAADSTVAVTGASTALDLGDNDINESDILLEIATTGDTNNVFTEPSDDKLLIDLGINWPTSDTADALSANGSNCSANEAARGVTAVGAGENCQTLDGDGLTVTAGTLSADLGTSIVTGEITDDTILEVDLDAVDVAVDEECLTYEATGLGFEWQSCSAGSGDVTDVGDCTTGACLTADGTGSTIYLEGSTADGFETIIGTDDPTADRAFNFPNDELADDDVLIGDGAGSLIYVVLSDCDGVTDGITYDVTTNVFGCNTLGGHTTDTGPSPDCSGTTTYQDGEGGCDTLDAGTDITANLEEELHCAEHSSVDLTCSGETLIFAVDSVDWTEIVQNNTLVGDPTFLVDECFFIATSSGGGLLCEGSIADGNEQLYLFPDVNGSDTTSRIVIDNTEVTSIDGTGLTISSGILEVDLGTSIVTGEITDDTILEADFDATNSPTDEYCLTFESGAGGDFEWQVCSGEVTLLGSGSDADSTTTVTGSGLETIGGALTIIRGCSDDQVLAWNETTDVWRCVTIAGTGITVTGDTFDVDLGISITTGEIVDDEILEVDLDAVDTASDEECLTYEDSNSGFEWQSCGSTSLVDPGSDGDSSVGSSSSGLELIGGDITLIRGCGDNRVLIWTESTDTWNCDLIRLRDNGSDADSTTTTTGSGLEYINGDLTIIRGCDDNEVLSWDESTDQWRCLTLAGDGLTVTGDILAADLGTSIVTGEITDDTILEVDLDFVDTAVDEECLTYESGGGGDFEWQSCGGTVTLVNPGSDNDSTTTVTASGLENIGGVLTLIRGCANEDALIWDESVDVWACVDIEEETHATEHKDGGNDELAVEDLATACTLNQFFQADGSLNVDCRTLVAADISDQNAGTDITVDLEEEAHCSEHSSVDLTCATETLIFAVDSIDLAEIVQNNTLGGDPAFLVDECFLVATATGGGLICEGSTADGAEQLYLFPDVNGSDTTNRIVIDNTQVTSIDGDGLTISGGVLVADLGTAIVTGEITDDTILEADLDLVDTPNDEECLTFESGAGGDFEWEVCASVTLVDPGSDGDSTTGNTPSGLETIGGDLTLLRGCSEDQLLVWNEGSDTWGCNNLILRDNGSDNDSTTTVTGSGLEYISGDLTIIRGCDDNEVLGWDEGSDLWRCLTLAGTGLTVTDDILAADLGTAITTGEITDDEILEVDLDVVDTAVDEECLTFESSNSGFEWQTCGSTLTLVNPGSNGDSTTTVTASGLERISGNLTIIRGCSDDESLAWNESSDVWRCVTIAGDGITVIGDTFDVDLGTAIDTSEITDDTILEADLDFVDTAVDEQCLTFESGAGGDFEWQDCSSLVLVNPGSDADSTTTVTASGLETIAGELTLIRGCSDDQVLVWDESTDVWRCVTYSTGLTVTGDNITVDLGTAITTGEITDDEILEVDLDAVDAAIDEECLTFETSNSGFEWQDCNAGIVVGDITDVNAGTDLTADLEEENHCSEHASADLDCSTETLVFAASSVETGEIVDGTIIEADLNAIDAAGDEECLTSEGTGFEWQDCGGTVTLVNPGSDSDSTTTVTASGLEDIGGSLTLIRGCADDEVLMWNESTDVWRCGSVSGTGLTVTGDTLAADLGTSIITSEITDDTILEVDLDAIDTATDEECLTYEADNSGFEWQACSGSVTLLNPGADADSTTTVTSSGLEEIAGALTLIRGCNDNEFLVWTESSDVWACSEVPVLTSGSDGDSSVVTADGGLELIGGRLTLIRGCDNNELLLWIESTDSWDCITIDGDGLTVSGTTLVVDLGTAIDTSEITDDTILEADFDATDSAVDEECLTFESGAGGDFEWQTCGGEVTLVNPGANADSTTTVTASGLETIAGNLTIIRGCSDDQVLGWNESTDVWRCITLAGDGLTMTGDTLSVDLGTAIVTGEITDGTILEADLDALDAAVDEECLTYENDALHFEWQDCNGGIVAADIGDLNANTDITADLEEEDHCSEHASVDLTCSTETLIFASGSVETGVITNDTILEIDLDAVDTAVDEECLTFETSNSGFEWQTCNTAQNLFETITDSVTSLVADSTTDTFTVAVSGNAVSTIFDAGSDTMTIVVDTRNLFEEKTAMFVQTGDVDVALDIENIRIYNTFGSTGTIQNVSCWVNTVGTSSAITVDVNKNGTTIFTTQGGRPTLVASDNFDTSDTPDVTIFADGDYLQIEIDASDSGDTGADLTCGVDIRFRIYDTSS